MTAQEAIEILNNYGSLFPQAEQKAIDVAVSALKKQIPKKPDTDVINRGIDVSGEYDIENNYICPDCKSVVDEVEIEEHYYDFCPECGQALDWSDEE